MIMHPYQVSNEAGNEIEIEAEMVLILVPHAYRESRPRCIYYLIELNFNNLLSYYVYGLCLLVCSIVP
jgi:hypothetical protein